MNISDYFINVKGQPDIYELIALYLDAKTDKVNFIDEIPEHLIYKIWELNKELNVFIKPKLNAFDN